jgi:small subunit ribosomal protein S16
MSVRIRLARVGATRQPSYRVVATDRRRARDGRSLEILGHYNPRTEPMTLVLDLAKVDAWIAKGAQPSDVVGKLITKARGGAAVMGGKTGPKAAEKGFTAPGTRPAVVEETVVVEAAPEAVPDAAPEVAAEVAPVADVAPSAVETSTPEVVASAQPEVAAEVPVEAPAEAVAESPAAPDADASSADAAPAQEA